MGKIMQAFDIVSIDEPWLSPTMLASFMIFSSADCWGISITEFLDCSSRCVTSTHMLHIQPGFSLETGFTDVENQTHPRVLGL